MVMRTLYALCVSALSLPQAVMAGEGSLGGQPMESVVEKKLGPDWSDEQLAAGQSFGQAWQQYAAASKPGQGTTGDRPTFGAEEGKVAAVLARHDTELMAYPHVVAVADGICTREGQPTGEACIVVYVDRKLPEDQLEEGARLPSEIDGVPVDVVEVGEIGILPR